MEVCQSALHIYSFADILSEDAIVLITSIFNQFSIQSEFIDLELCSHIFLSIISKHWSTSFEFKIFEAFGYILTMKNNLEFLQHKTLNRIQQTFKTKLKPNKQLQSLVLNSFEKKKLAQRILFKLIQ